MKKQNLYLCKIDGDYYLADLVNNIVYDLPFHIETTLFNGNEENTKFKLQAFSNVTSKYLISKL